MEYLFIIVLNYHIVATAPFTAAYCEQMKSYYLSQGIHDNLSLGYVSSATCVKIKESPYKAHH